MHKFAPYVLLLSVFILTGCTLQNAGLSVDTLSILSYNIRHGVSLNDQFNPEGIVETITHSGADIISLQEVDQRWSWRSQYLNELDWLAQKLHMYSAFGPAMVSQNGQYGVGILSKYPIIRAEYYPLPGRLEPRVLLVAQIKIHDQTLYVFDTHLGLSVGDRIHQVPEILRIAEKYAGQNILLMGDFNTDSDAPELSGLFKYFTEHTANLSTGTSGTLIGHAKVIDHIYTSRSIAVQELATLLSPFSDHYPLYAKIQILHEAAVRTP